MEQVLLEAELRYMVNREVTWDNKNGFTKAKSCLTNQEAFCDGVSISAEDRRARDDIYLDFCKAFDMLPTKILLPKLERDGFWWVDCSVD